MVDVSRSCLFCDIAAKKVAAAIVYEDESCIAFLDHRPVFIGHSLLVPKLHVETYFELRPAELAPFSLAAQRLGVAVQNAMQADGIFMAMNNRVSQSVPHLHQHIVPRRFKDGLRGFFWPRMKYTPELPLEEVQRRILAAAQEMAK